MSKEASEEHARRRSVALALSAVVGLWMIAVAASRGADGPSRCGEGLVATATRCCARGQEEREGRCVGAPLACDAQHDRGPDGCVPRDARIAFAGGSLRLGPSDWEAGGVVAPRLLRVDPFALDRFEATERRVRHCVSRGICPPIALSGDDGRAAVLPFAEARTLCRFEGGRLPTDDEWTFAAMGEAARRYPWGDTGAVCRRAAFGLSVGPCAKGATGPDTVGARAAGVSPEGLFDLAGNVAEWVESGTARGGSFATGLASELRGWNQGVVMGTTGVRCAYDRSPEAP